MAISAWEDPSNLRVIPRQSGTKSSAKPKTAAGPAAESWISGAPFTRVLHRMYHNSIRYMGTLFRLSPLSPIILLGLLISCWMVRRGSAFDRSVILVSTLLLYPAGYLMIHIHERFFWLVTFLLTLSAGLLTTALPVLRRKPWSICWAGVVVLSFSVWPVWLLARLRHHVLEETPAVAAQLQSIMPPGTRIASDQEWGITNSIAFHLDAQYYGLLRPGASAKDQEQQLREHHIRYLLVWGDPARYPFLASGREVPTEPVAGWPHERWPHIFELPASPEKSQSSETEAVKRP